MRDILKYVSVLPWTLLATLPGLILIRLGHLGTISPYLFLVVGSSLLGILAYDRRRAERELRKTISVLEAQVDDQTGELEAVRQEKEDREKSSTKHRLRADDMERKLKSLGAELGEIRDRFETLSDREREVYRMVMEGLMNKQIAAKIGIAEVTVKIHRRNVMRKMDADTFAELVRKGERLRISLGPS